MNAMKKRVLITGFEPFGEDTVNASWEAVSRLEGRVGDWEVEKLLVPTVFGEAAKKVLEAARELQPDVILCVGQELCSPGWWSRAHCEDQAGFELTET